MPRVGLASGDGDATMTTRRPTTTDDDRRRQVQSVLAAHVLGPRAAAHAADGRGQEQHREVRLALRVPRAQGHDEPAAPVVRHRRRRLRLAGKRQRASEAERERERASQRSNERNRASKRDEADGRQSLGCPSRRRAPRARSERATAREEEGRRRPRGRSSECGGSGARVARVLASRWEEGGGIGFRARAAASIGRRALVRFCSPAAAQRESVRAPLRVARSFVARAAF